MTEVEAATPAGTFTPRPLPDVLSPLAQEVEETAVQVYVEAEGWDAEESVHETSQGIGRLQVAATPEGDVHLIWVEDGWLWHSLRVRDAWTEPHRLFAGIQPSVTVDEQGAIHMVFAHDFGGRHQVYYTRYREPLWTLPYEISRTPGISHNPHIVAAAGGLLYVVWEDDTPGYPSIYHAYNPEGHWINAPVPGARGWRPALACDGKGGIHLVWESAIPNQQGDDVYHSQLTPSGWSLPENISDSPSTDSSLPTTAGGPDDVVHVVWQERLGGHTVVGYAFGRYASWLKPVALTTGGHPQRPHITLSPKGYVHVLWVDGNVLGYRGRGPAADSPWHNAQKVAQAPDGISHLSVYCDREGHVHAAWVSEAHGRRTLCYRRREAAMKHKQFIPAMVG